MAFIRRSGIAPLLGPFAPTVTPAAYSASTTTYTGSTEPLALGALRDLGAEVRVSYDMTTTRLHARPGTSIGGLDSRPRTSARRTGPIRPRSAAWNGMFACPAPGTPTSSKRSAPCSRATGTAATSSRTTPRRSEHARKPRWSPAPPSSSARSNFAQSRSKSACSSRSHSRASAAITVIYWYRPQVQARPSWPPLITHASARHFRARDFSSSPIARKS
jgi:hypothetical protein